MRATRWQRISSEEEERAREGYHVTTHFRFPAGLPARDLTLSEGEEGKSLLEVRLRPASPNLADQSWLAALRRP